MAFDVGINLRYLATFRNTAEVKVDPSLVVLKIKKPDGVVVEPTVTKDSVGEYHATLAADQDGVWRWRWEGTGSNQAAQEGQFSVRLSDFSSG